MARKITIDPITRIEGHARVELDIDDSNRVTGAMFQVLDFRGWETFLRGMQVENMATITPRICGTCPQTHHLASARTLDKVFDVKIPRSAELLRYAADHGGQIHSHAVHFFALAAPDLLMGIDSKPELRNIVGLVKAAPDLATKALRLRSVGQKVVELIGGRGTHPVSCVAGGLSTPLGKDKKDIFQRLANESLALGKELVAVGKKALMADKALAESLPLKTNYLGTNLKGAFDVYQGALRFVTADGASKFEFSEDDYTKHLVEYVAENTYTKHVRFRKDATQEPVTYRVGPLARMNTCDHFDTPLAQAEFEQFKKVGGVPCHQTMFYHYARLIELLHAAEKIVEISKDDETYSDNVRGKLNGPRSATAHVEAPRGNLIHDYQVDSNGIVQKANLIVATQQNIPAINATIGMAAQKFINQPDAFLLNAIEVGIRCYDPCLSCATHRHGEMKLDVVIRQDGREIRRVRR